MVAVLATIGCSGTNSEIKVSNQNLATQIMELHDSAMVHSGRILKLKTKANQEADSLVSGPRCDSLRLLSASLYKADKLMLDWMHQYQEPNPESDSTQAYLTKQLDLIKLVKNQTDSSLHFAKLLWHESN